MQRQATEETPGLSSFTLTDWGLLVGVALVWGSSFVFIAEGLEAFEPAVIAWLRLAFGALSLVWFRAARVPVGRREWPAIGLLGLLWMAVPFLLFPLAQQWIDSSLAGMINGGVPVFAALIAAAIARRLPSSRQITGILIGFTGVILVGWPALQGARSTAVGVGLVLLAVVMYGFAINIAVPLQRRLGSLPVLLRAQAVGLVFMTVPAALSLPASSFSASSFAAMVPLGALGTGLAFVALSTLAGRVGAARGSLPIYFVPIVAMVLGSVLRNEDIAPISIAGTFMVIAGAVLASRAPVVKPSGMEDAPLAKAASAP